MKQLSSKLLFGLAAFSGIGFLGWMLVQQAQPGSSVIKTSSPIQSVCSAYKQKNARYIKKIERQSSLNDWTAVGEGMTELMLETARGLGLDTRNLGDIPLDIAVVCYNNGVHVMHGVTEKDFESTYGHLLDRTKVNPGAGRRTT